MGEIMKKTIRDFDLSGKKVLIRCDFNVPIDSGKITDDTRIVASLDTIKYAISRGAKVILFSHLGRVKTEEDLVKNNLEIVSVRLSELLNQPVYFSNMTRGEELEDKVNSLKSGEVLLVQNTRYEDLEGKKESSNDLELGKYWASLGDIFINDAFGTAHRAHASNVGIATNLPSGVGFLIEKELNALSSLDNPERDFVVILGGSKVSDKIGLIENLVTKVDKLVIGGGMAFTFLKAKGLNVGKSVVDTDNIEFCKKILEEYNDKILLPVDVHVTSEFSNDVPSRIVSVDNILENEMGLDLGIESINNIIRLLESAKTVFWNGPLGVYEFEKYRLATKKVLEYLVSTEKQVILGGGDIVACASNLGYKDKVTHASTGGGATLEYLEGKILPGIDIIQDK